MIGRQRPKAKSRSLTAISDNACAPLTAGKRATGFGMTIGGSGPLRLGVNEWRAPGRKDRESPAVEEKARRPKQASAGRKRRQAAALQRGAQTEVCATRRSKDGEDRESPAAQGPATRPDEPCSVFAFLVFGLRVGGVGRGRGTYILMYEFSQLWQHNENHK
jgi:hypothetical protein